MMPVSVRRKCDALHETAERVEQIWRNCPDKEGNIALLNAASLMCDAAETMERLDAENAANVVKSANLITTRDELYEDNAKLRELVRDMNKAAHMLCEAWEGSCSREAEGMSLHAVCPIGDTSELCLFGRLDERMQELGIEVD